MSMKPILVSGEARNVILHIVTVGARKAVDWPRIDRLRFLDE
jgi:hypothetical protein